VGSGARPRRSVSGALRGAVKALIRGGGAPPPPDQIASSTVLLGRMGNRFAMASDAQIIALLDENDSQLAEKNIPLRAPYTQGLRRCLERKGGLPKQVNNGSLVAEAKIHLIQRHLHHFQTAISQGYSTWFAVTILLEKAVRVYLEDYEGRYVTTRAIDIFRRRCGRINYHPQIGYSVERAVRNPGLHSHLLVSSTPELHAETRRALVASVATALECTESSLKCPVAKFHGRRGSLLSAPAAQGWWHYCLGAIPEPGAEILGVTGKSGCLPLRCSPIGWSRGRGNG